MLWRGLWLLFAFRIVLWYLGVVACRQLHHMDVTVAAAVAVVVFGGVVCFYGLVLLMLLVLDRTCAYGLALCRDYIYT